MYESLKKLYYKHNDNAKTEGVYQSRLHSDSTRVFPISIHQYNRRHEYPAFLCYTQEIILLTENIYSQHRKLERLIERIPSIVLHQFFLVCVVDEVQSTNDIEGVKSTRREIREILDEAHEPLPHLESVVQKYHELILNKEIEFNTCEDIRYFYDSFAYEEVKRNDPSNALDGKLFRKESVDIVTETNKVIHRGLMPEEKIISTMEKALAILHDHSIPTLIRIALFHYLFAYIHPWYDGNGRTSRFISAYFLSKHLSIAVAMRLSVIIKKRRKQYYQLFEDADSELNRGDLTLFVCGFLNFILEGINDAIRYLRYKNAQLQNYKEKLEKIVASYGLDKLSGDIAYILLQASLFYGQGIPIKELMSLTHHSRVTVQNRLDNLPKGWVNKSGIKPIRYKLNPMIFRQYKKEVIL